MYLSSELSSIIAWVIKQAMSAENKWFASEHLGHEATPEECVEHYLKFGPPVIYVQEYYVEESDDGQGYLFI